MWVLRLCRVIYGSGRKLPIDNFFTSLHVIKKLLNVHKSKITGTVKKNKRELPIESNPTIRPQDVCLYKGMHSGILHTKEEEKCTCDFFDASR